MVPTHTVYVASLQSQLFKATKLSQKFGSHSCINISPVILLYPDFSSQFHILHFPTRIHGWHYVIVPSFTSYYHEIEDIGEGLSKV